VKQSTEKAIEFLKRSADQKFEKAVEQYRQIVAFYEGNENALRPAVRFDSNSLLHRPEQCASDEKPESRNLIVDLDRYEFLHHLGRSRFGEVALVREQETGRGYVMKRFRYVQSSMASRQREIEGLIQLVHECILPIIGYSPSQFAILTEFMPNESLKEQLAKPPNLSLLKDNTSKAMVIAGIALGMRFVHSRNMIHGDLKPSNILFDAEKRIRISDLETLKCAEWARNGTTDLGTPRYMAPELYDGTT